MRLHEIINAYGLITGEKIDEEQIEYCRKAVYRSKRNIVIIGMPTAGKTTISNLLSRCHARTVSEMDDFIIRETGMSISDYFSKFGEKSFRERESEICRKLSEGTGAVISTGGGVVIRHENMLQLAANSLIVWLDRDLPLLEGREDRPLSSDRTSLERLYEERRPLYEKYSDIRIENNMTIEDVMKALEEVFS